MSVHWGEGATYDLLPKILPHFDKHMSVNILDNICAEYNNVSFNPYTKESFVKQLEKLLSTTARQQDYQTVLHQLQEVDESLQDEEVVQQKIDKVSERAAAHINYINDTRNKILTLYFDDHQTCMKRDVDRITNVLSVVADSEEKPPSKIEITTMKNPEPHWVDIRPNDVMYDSYQNYQIRSNLDNLFKFGRAFYELGFPGEAEAFLQKYQYWALLAMETQPNRVGFVDEAKSSEIKKMNNQLEQALWGTMSCQLILGKFSTTLFEQLNSRLGESYDFYSQGGRLMHSQELALVVKKHAWLLHWVLWQNLLNELDGQRLPELYQIFNNDNAKNCITTVCPWLLRYLVLAAVCTHSLETKIKYCRALANDVLAVELDSYKDPLTEFVRTLFCECDYEAAAAHLKECRKVFTIDVFLASQCLKFFDAARLLLFSQYSKVNLKMPMDEIGRLLMLGKHGVFEDDHIWCVGEEEAKVPVHQEKRDLTNWITDTVRLLQQENTRSSEDREDRQGPTYKLRIDLRQRVLLSKPTHEDPNQALLNKMRNSLKESKRFNETLKGIRY